MGGIFEYLDFHALLRCMVALLVRRFYLPNGAIGKRLLPYISVYTQGGRAAVELRLDPPLSHICLSEDLVCEVVWPKSATLLTNGLVTAIRSKLIPRHAILNALHSTISLFPGG